MPPHTRPLLGTWPLVTHPNVQKVILKISYSQMGKASKERLGDLSKATLGSRTQTHTVCHMAHGLSHYAS